MAREKARLGWFLRYLSIFGSLNYYSISLNMIFSSKILKFCIRIENSAVAFRQSGFTQNKLPFPSALFNNNQYPQPHMSAQTIRGIFQHDAPARACVCAKMCVCKNIMYIIQNTKIEKPASKPSGNQQILKLFSGGLILGGWRSKCLLHFCHRGEFSFILLCIQSIQSRYATHSHTHSPILDTSTYVCSLCANAIFNFNTTVFAWSVRWLHWKANKK